jgi:hypothetical protein
MNDNQREEMIRSAIKTMASKGIQLASQTWGIVWDRKSERFAPQKSFKCCALGCVLLSEQEKQERITDWKSLHLESILNVNTDWIRDFQSGFDGHQKANTHDNGAFELGLLLRAEIVQDAQTSLLLV